MELLKRLSFFISATVCAMLLPSCLDDSPSESYFPTLGTVGHRNAHLTLDSDTYGTLFPLNPGWFSSEEADTDGQRVLVSVVFRDASASSAVEDALPVEILSLYKVLTKSADDIRTSGTSPDSFGTDPVQITAAGISKDHLNIQYTIDASDTDRPHRFSLLLTPDSRIGTDGLMELEFRHDARSDARRERFWGIASYTLASIPEVDSPSFRGFKIIYNSGADSRAEWIVWKDSSEGKMTFGGTMSPRLSF